MRTSTSILSCLALLLSLQLLGCSGSDETQTNPTSSGTPTSQTGSPSDATTSSDETAAEGGNQRGGNETVVTDSDTEATIDPDAGVPKSIKEPHLMMTLEDGIQPQFQNGPSKEEVARYQKLLKRKPKSRSKTKSGQTAPVFDTEMVKVKI